MNVLFLSRLRELLQSSVVASLPSYLLAGEKKKRRAFFSFLGRRKKEKGGKNPL